MSYKKLVLLGGVCALSACSYVPSEVGGGHHGGYIVTQGPRYTPRPNIPVSQETEANFQEDRYDRKQYNDYDQSRDEQCQHYRRVPRNSVVMPNCAVVRAPMGRVVETQTTTTGPIMHSYTLYFGFNKSDIRPSEQATVDQIASEIEKYHPGSVTVTGFADRSGSADYNKKLSAKRAQMVSNALTGKGVPNQVLDEAARGEDDNAVPTKDGVRMQANRRVVVDFRR